MASKILQTSAVRWFIVGSATFVLDTGLFLLLFKITSIAALSNLISVSTATIFNYLAHYHWSFSSTRGHKQSTLIYLVSFFIFLFLGTTLVSFLIHSGIHPLPSKVGTAAIIAPMSFLLMKFVTFRTSHES